ncbi:MAG TPA: WYL domain-containing protein [Acidimicrobiales bacterium]|nr:WYL domain-containing protein [Acidimicrobiales bacterium]
MATPDRLERLTDLVLVLLHARQPMTLDEIAREVPGYPAAHDARRQAFERDKRLLRDEGMPVLTEQIGGPDQYGYRIDPDAFYLPDLRLAPDEQAALHLAVAGVHLGDPSGRDALLKLGATGAGEARPVAALVPPPALVPLFDAVRHRAEVAFGYRGDRRRVAPAAVRFRNGRWYLIGWDLDRQAARTFRVDRVDGVPAPAAPGSGPVPAGFDPAAEAPEEPWRTGDGDPADVLLWVDPVEAPRVVEEVGQAAVQDRRPDGAAVLRLGVSSTTALRSWVLGLLDHAEVLEPPSFRSDLVSWLEAVAGGRWDPAVAALDPAGLDSAAPDSGAPDSAVLDSGAVDPTGGAAALSGGGRPAGADGEPSELPGTGGPAGRLRDPSSRLRRLLAIVGWLARVGEAPITEIAGRFNLAEDEVVRELELAACCGVPPYSPDALLEIVVTDETVRAFLPEDLARPRRLTAAEGFALAASARTILAVPGADETGALARALAKLDAVLGDHQGLVVDLDEPSLLAEARQAVDDRSAVEIEYHSASSDQTTLRVVEPLEVVSLDGHWYMDAYCHRAAGLRRFRVDRVRSLRVVGPRSVDGPARGDGSSAFVPGPGAVTVRLALGPDARWVADTVPVLDARPAAGGATVVTLAVGGRAWLERLLLQVGPHARVLGPPDLAGVAVDAARRVLRRYAGADPGTPAGVERQR